MGIVTGAKEYFPGIGAIGFEGADADARALVVADQRQAGTLRGYHQPIYLIKEKSMQKWEAGIVPGRIKLYRHL